MTTRTLQSHGHGQFTAVQLKAIQEIITLAVFTGFSIFYLNERITLNHLIGFVFLILAGVTKTKIIFSCYPPVSSQAPVEAE